MIYFFVYWEYQKRSLAKKWNCKEIQTLPLNYGLGQAPYFFQPESLYDFYVNLALDPKNKDGVVGYHFLLFPGVLVWNPTALKEIYITKQKNFPKPPTMIDQFQTLIGDGLVSSQGDHWKFHRTLINPVFSSTNVEIMSEMMLEETKKFIDLKWEKLTKDGVFIVEDISQEMSNLTLRIISATSFGADNEELLTEMSHLWEKLIEGFGNLVMLIPLFGQYFQYFPTRSNLEFVSNKKRMAELVKTVINKKRSELSNSKNKGKELLSLMLDASSENNEKMSEQGLLDESLTFLFAGHDTTSSLLSSFLWKIATTKDVQQKLHDELDQYKYDIKYSDLPNLTYMNKCIKELLRMFPPANGTGKFAVEPMEIANYAFPSYVSSNLVYQQSFINGAILTAHHNPEVYKNPTEFNPDRWTEDFDPKYSYLPFSLGPRNCVGRLFAETEAPLLAAYILKRYNVEFIGEKKVVLDSTFVMKVKNCKLKFTKRKQ